MEFEDYETNLAKAANFTARCELRMYSNVTEGVQLNKLHRQLRQDDNRVFFAWLSWKIHQDRFWDCGPSCGCFESVFGVSRIFLLYLCTGAYRSHHGLRYVSESSTCLSFFGRDTPKSPKRSGKKKHIADGEPVKASRGTLRE